MSYNGQAEQDKFVLHILKEKRNGFFLEIGSSDPISINNTYLLEKEYDWKGIMVDYDQTFISPYKNHRLNSIHIIDDATKIDYKSILNNNNAPLQIDYLQIDLEVSNNSTIITLENLDKDVFDKYKFATITFEHDIYNYSNHTRLKSREIFKNRGYVCVFNDVSNGNNPYEDWYVHPDLVDMDYVNELIEINKKNYTSHPITGETIEWKNIEYL
jgi:hypothetical protein